MAFKMSFNKEELGGRVPVTAGWYTLQLVGFKPKFAALKAGETESGSLSLNAMLKIINHPDYENRVIFAGLNTKMAWTWPDFVHALGMEMEEVQDEFTGTEKANFTIPGVFEGADENPTDATNWKYLGPLLNLTMEAEIAEIPAQGGFGPKNEVRQYKCAVPGCTMKHSTNLIFVKK